MLKKSFFIFAITLFASTAHAQTENYDECMRKAGSIGDSAMAVCMTEETKRVMQDIKTVYEEALKEELLSNWSGGQGMRSGNLRNMFETWLNYRNRYCSFYTVGNSEYVGSNEYNNADCILDLSKQHLIDVKKVVITSKSYLSDGF